METEEDILRERLQKTLTAMSEVAHQVGYLVGAMEGMQRQLKELQADNERLQLQLDAQEVFDEVVDLSDRVEELADECLATREEVERLQRKLEMTSDDRNEALEYLQQVLRYATELDEPFEHHEQQVTLRELATVFLKEHSGYEGPQL